MVKPLIILIHSYLSLITITGCYQTRDKMLVSLIAELRLLAGNGVIHTMCGVDYVAAGEDQCVLAECTV